MLPPLRDVSNRPEVGTTLRNKLVRLMTHVDLGVKQIAAEFLFVLCKERGKRLVVTDLWYLLASTNCLLSFKIVRFFQEGSFK